MTAFDSEKYIAAQTAALKERITRFPKGKLYFEIGGKLLNDTHASRVLPGFDPDSKVKVLQNFTGQYGIIFCINSVDIQQGRVWTPGESYADTLWKALDKITASGLTKPLIAINVYKRETETDKLISELQTRGYEVFIRYDILGYPHNIDEIVGPNGYGKDEYLAFDQPLVVVTSLGANSGKMSTCLGQIYLDTFRGMDSGYAKYETFPIWNLPITHPVNLAYEAATMDIGNVTVVDQYHQDAHGAVAVNYNRDVDIFPILTRVRAHIVAPDNYMHSYKSPTDMGINLTKEGIVDEPAVIAAAIAEIKSRIQAYQAQGNAEWITRSQELLAKAESYSS
jgi:uncharacterized protein (UPF0371 family)